MLDVLDNNSPIASTCRDSNRNALKSAIVKSNVVTYVTINNKTMTVTEAVEIPYREKNEFELVDVIGLYDKIVALEAEIDGQTYYFKILEGKNMNIKRKNKKTMLSEEYENQEIKKSSDKLQKIFGIDKDMACKMANDLILNNAIITVGKGEI